MPEVTIRCSDLEPVKSLLVATGAIVEQWEGMDSCYSSSEENVQLAELLDDLCTVVRELRGDDRG